MQIRQARSEDCAAILAFWNPVIRDSHATFNSEEKTPEMLVEDIRTKSTRDYPFLVAEEAGNILGFATYSQFRASNGYRHTVEHTVIISPAAKGKGAGRALMLAIEDHARQRAVHSMFAGVSGRNPDGIAFHAALGYKEVARLPEVGRKFDLWYDLVLMQKFL